MTRAPFPVSNSKTAVMELLHVDITGPFAPSVGGARYLMMMYKDSTGLAMGVPIRAKINTGWVLMGKIPELERRCGKKLKRIRFDCAREFVTPQLLAWYGERGINHEVTPPYSPESNGEAERVNRTVKERVRAALAEAGFEEELRAEAAVAAIFVMNRPPKERLDMTPWEAFTGERPDVSGMAVWGSMAYALKPLKQHKGMQPRTVVGKMVGYAPGRRAYRVLLSDTKTVVVRRDVAFDEAPTAISSREVRWADDVGADETQLVADVPRHSYTPSGRGTPTLTPSSSGGSSRRMGTAPVTPDVQAAIDAARMVTGAMADEEGSSSEADEIEERYPTRTRAAPRRYGQSGGSASTNAVEVGDQGSAMRPVLVHDLPPAPKSVKEAMRRED